MQTAQLDLDKAIQEVIVFHTNIEAWFHGTATDKEALLSEMIAAFSPSFSMTNGDGKTMSYDAFVQWLPSAYGLFPTRSIEVHSIRGFTTLQHLIVDYIEVQHTGDVTTKRRSSAVFIMEHTCVKWFHLLEKWVY